MLLGRLIVDDVAQINRGRLMDLLVPDLKWTTLLLWFIWSVLCHLTALEARLNY